jgi:protein TonB
MSISSRSAALFRDDAQLRMLLACFGISVALHSLALLALSGLKTTARSDTTTVLTAFFAPRMAPAALSVEKAGPKPQEPTPKARPEERSTVLARPLSGPVVPGPAEVTPAQEPSQPSEIASAQPTASLRTLDPSASPAVAAERPPVDGLDAGLLENYRLALIDAARRYRRYPLQAMDRGWQGRVEIRLVIGTNGTIKNATIKTSSRYPILDDQALQMVKKGKSLAQIPPALSGREFTVDVPVIFELQTG